ncbi:MULTISPECIES: hypothetical protein [Thalassospira]|uniref:Uncharacterized protein n=1 Tax=Thalassospira profundimaris TaxID=502049 RepID=A0A367WV64_9PROT|nr:hypothetical protein [Thalassospira profundimaris]RCK45356.1 hypothetical protein TH30_12280 [Thalassospira profundimaris]
MRAQQQDRNWNDLKSGKEKSGGKTAAEFGWDTSKLQKITLFQAQSAPAKNNCPQSYKQEACQLFKSMKNHIFLGDLANPKPERIDSFK